MEQLLTGNNNTKILISLMVVNIKLKRLLLKNKK